MTDNTRKNPDTDRIYTLLLALKDEVARLSSQVKALKNQLKGVKDNG